VRLEKGLGRDNRVPKQAAGQPSELPEGGHSMSSSNAGGYPQPLHLVLQGGAPHAELRRSTRWTGDHPMGFVQGAKEA
jgi:hypothetical protein